MNVHKHEQEKEKDMKKTRGHSKWMDQCGPIGDGCVCLLAANAMFRRSWRIDIKVLGVLLGVEMLQSVQLYAPDPLTRGSVPGPCWGLCPKTPVIGSHSALALYPSRCPSMEKFLWVPMTIETVRRENLID